MKEFSIISKTRLLIEVVYSRSFGFSPLLMKIRIYLLSLSFICREKMENFVEKSILTKFFVSFSRDEGQEEAAARYVQDNIKQHQDYIIPLIVEKGAIIYICG